MEMMCRFFYPFLFNKKVINTFNDVDELELITIWYVRSNTPGIEVEFRRHHISLDIRICTDQNATHQPVQFHRIEDPSK